ncbi:MAG: PQQ-binding-like beta-propeller repeat protein [Acidobacteria bacterium]|nr:PQQ-binding-like beta-propeller repeat protein [Acidobacteriota bacterium]
MRRWWMLVAAALAVGVAPGAQDAGTAPAADWPMYNRDLAGSRHSPLRQIDTGNVGRLTTAWTLPLGRHPTTGSITGGSEFTPIVIGGVLYYATHSAVLALDGDTGREIWRREITGGSPSRRGVTYWPGDGTIRPRLFVTAGLRLLALDAATGEPVRAFGVEDDVVGEVALESPYQSAPTLYGSLLIVGSNGAPGAVRAYDARTGGRVWEFRSVPQPAERAQETWAGDSWQTAAPIAWTFSLTIDAARGTVYAVFDSPTPDYYGGARAGNNLYANSIVALDAATGAYRWHFQTVHHDLWDYDLPAPPGLIDVTVNGTRVPALAQAGKTGYLYILNRVTGEPLFGIEERPVPSSPVPGEQSSPTQPIPVKPGPIARVQFAPGDLVTAADTTEAHAAFCRALAERSGGLYNAGPFTPYLPRTDGRSTVLFPGSVGGANWGGTASDPSLGYVFVNTMDEASLGWIESREGAGGQTRMVRNSVVGTTSRFQWHDGTPDGPGNIVGSGEDAWPCQRPPWGQLVAVNVATGEIAWQVPLGITEELPEARQRTGRLNMGGPITTAGGLVFIGASNDRRFRAFDSRTGRELWVTQLPMSAHAVPITYLGRTGRQYVAITAAGASALDDPAPEGSESLIVFALPE